MKPGDRILTIWGAAEVIEFIPWDRVQFGYRIRETWVRVRYDDGTERLIPPVPDNTVPITTSDET